MNTDKKIKYLSEPLMDMMTLIFYDESVVLVLSWSSFNHEYQWFRLFYIVIIIL